MQKSALPCRNGSVVVPGAVDDPKSIGWSRFGPFRGAKIGRLRSIQHCLGDQNRSKTGARQACLGDQNRSKTGARQAWGHPGTPRGCSGVSWGVPGVPRGNPGDASGGPWARLWASRGPPGGVRGTSRGAPGRSGDVCGASGVVFSEPGVVSGPISGALRSTVPFGRRKQPFFVDVGLVRTFEKRGPSGVS